MAHGRKDFWIRETGTGQQVAQLRDRQIDDDDDDDDEVHDSKYTACVCERIPGETYRRGIFKALHLVVLNEI